ncbi:MAG: glycosyltransferase [Bacteroidia bacterium]|nr:glycosyltransferase [Bacteroidia bacterium]
MNTADISFIIPVYNRPDEIKELLESFLLLEGTKDFEIVIIEDGSSIPSKNIIEQFNGPLNISYFYKENSGPGDSRNYGMQRAQGDYFIILDSDCVLPPNYLNAVRNYLSNHYVDCFGGPDAAHQSFSNIQKAINFSMTSFITTGGIRGRKGSVDKFQPRSFNMGLSKNAFLATDGFGKIHPGEDPDLSIRLENLGFETALIPEAFVYHKRRISWNKFYQQVNKFGMVRAILNKWHPQTSKLTYWFPTVFCIGLIAAILLWILGYPTLLYGYGIYFIISFILALIASGSMAVAFLAIVAILIQFFGYGFGFLKSNMMLSFSKKSAQDIFPNLFFK